MKHRCVRLLLCVVLCILLLSTAACAKDPNAAFIGAWAVPGYPYVCCFEEDGIATVQDENGTAMASGFYSVEGKQITVDMGGGYVSTGVLGNDVITFTEGDLTTEYHRIAADTPAPEESPQPTTPGADMDAPVPGEPSPGDAPATPVSSGQA